MKKNINRYNSFLNNEEYIYPNKHQIYRKPYLSGQEEWQNKLEVGVYLVYNNEVYQISRVCLEYGDNFVLDRVITRQYNVKTLSFSDIDVKHGKYKQIKEEELQEHLEKDYKHNIIEKFEKTYDIRSKWLSKKYDKINRCEEIIKRIQRYHKYNCTFESKIKIIGKLNLPINIISKIIGYGIESKCNDNYLINSVKEEIKDLKEIIDDDYEPYKNALWLKQVSYHVLQGNYEEWLYSC